MGKPFWRCEACNFEAENQHDKREHLKKMLFDFDHFLLLKKELFWPFKIQYE